MEVRALILCLLLAGCAAEPQKVSVPVVAGCVGPLPTRPMSTFGADTYLGEKDAAQAALIDGAACESYALKLEVIIAECR